MGKSIGSKRKVHSKKAQAAIVQAVEPAKLSPEIYFKVLNDQPVPVESSLGAMTLDQAAKKTKWDREAREIAPTVFRAQTPALPLA